MPTSSACGRRAARVQRIALTTVCALAAYGAHLARQVRDHIDQRHAEIRMGLARATARLDDIEMQTRQVPYTRRAVNLVGERITQLINTHDAWAAELEERLAKTVEEAYAASYVEGVANRGGAGPKKQLP